MNRCAALLRRRISRPWAALLQAIAVTAAIGIGGHAACAQDVAYGSKWEALITPYAWLPWLNIGVNPSHKLVPSASDTIDPGQLISHLTWVPFMGGGEFRNGPLSITFDYVHAPVKTGVTTHNVLFGGGGSGLTLDVGNITFLYRVVADPVQYLDVGGGTRVWGVNGNLSLNEGLLPAFNITKGGSWADPLIAARYHRELGNGFSATAYGDVGGFGAGADLDWEIVGTIDYALKPGVDLHGGFRTLNFNQTLPRAGVDVHMYGPVLAATFHF